MDYACCMWCHTKKSLVDKLQRVQNYAGRIINGNWDFINTHTIDIPNSLRRINVQERCDYFTAVLMAIHGLTPIYMTDNIVMVAETHDRDTRLSNSNNVNMPYHPIIQMYSNGHLSTTAVAYETISMMKSGWLPMCQILSAGTNVSS